MMGVARSWVVQVVLVVSLWAAMDLVGLGRRGLWNPVEPRYAGIAAEMARGGSWLVPHYNGEVYDQKPPAYFWGAAALMRIGGEDAGLLWVRLPSALGGLAAMLGVLVLGRWWWGGFAGLLAAVTLGGSWSVFWSGRFAHMDLPVTATVVWGVVGLWGALYGSGRQRVAWILVGVASLGLGAMLKGPVGPAFVALAWGIWTLLPGGDGSLATLRRSGLGWMLGGALALGLAWLLPAWSVAGDGWVRELALGQGVGRLLDAFHPHKHGWLYYPMVFWGLAAPWGLLLPVALWAGWRRGDDPADRRCVALATVWLVVVVCLLSLGETRRSRYLIPAMPAVALLIGRMLAVDVLARDWSAGRRWTLAVALVAALPAAAAAAILLAPEVAAARIGGDSVVEALDQLAATPGRVLAGVLLSLAFGAVLAVILRRRVVASLLMGALALAATAVAWGLVGAPAVDGQRGDGELIDLLRERCGAGRELWVLGRQAERESALGFLGFHVRQRVGVLPRPGSGILAACRRERSLVLVVREQCHAGFLAELRDGWRAVAPGPLGHDQLWVYENAWPPRQGF